MMNFVLLAAFGLQVAPLTRRAAIGGLALSVGAHPTFAKGEAVKAAAAAREAAEAEAAKPLTKLTRALELLGGEADGYLYEQQWDELRNLFQASPLADVRAITGPVPASNGMMKGSLPPPLTFTGDSSALRSAYLDSVFEIETFAYKQQKNSPTLRGCAMTRTPKGDLESCFVNIDAPQAALKRAAAALEKLIATAK